MAALFVAYWFRRLYVLVMAQKILASMALVAMLPPPTAQAANPPLQLKASTSWHVDYAVDRCRLMRQFGEGDERVSAIFDRYGPEESFRMTISGKPVKTFVENGEATVQFGPAESEQRIFFLNGNLAEDPALVFASRVRVAPPTPAEQITVKQQGNDEWIEFADIGPAREAAIRYLSIGKPLRRSVVLETGSMRAPLAALNKCVENLLTHWGINVEKHRNLTTRAAPAGNPAKWVVSRDYPVKMLQSGQPAIVEFRLSVGVDGIPSACHIQSTTRPIEFDKAVCGSLMKRARFTPAIDAEGKPLASYYRNTVRFALP